MINGVRVAVSKTLSSYHKAVAWDLIRVYDTLMRKYGISLITWSIDDKDDHYVIVAKIPGDFAPELGYAKAEIQEAIVDITEQHMADEEELY